MDKLGLIHSGRRAVLHLPGSLKRLDGRIGRRDLLRIGGLGSVGLGLHQLLGGARTAAAANDRPDGFGRAKKCLLLFLYGSPSQLETFDMKPAAPVEVRGPMQPIASSLPGLDVCEHLPHTARVMDRCTVIRSLHHEYPIHGVAYATTGIPAINVQMELSPKDPEHHPFLGSVVNWADERRGTANRSFPQNVALPFPFSTQRTGEVHRAGPYAASLGSEHNPVWTEFVGQATRSVVKTLRNEDVEIHDPYVGCSADSHFRLSTSGPLDGMTDDRLARRRSLLERFDATRRDLERTDIVRGFDRYQEMAFELVTSSKVAEALDVRRETPETLDLYGPTLFGRACLAGRRMLDAGTRLATVFWDEYGLAGDAWDTHWNHFPRMQDQLLPPFDRAFSGLIADLDRRGQLDDTLVVCLSEHGRTVKLKTGKGGGRDHWSRAYSAVLAGGGIARGSVVGATDAHAADVVANPVGPKDLLATIYHLLGIDPHLEIPGPGGRPVHLLPTDSRVVTEALV
jgi:hypothetical protein